MRYKYSPSLCNNRRKMKANRFGEIVVGFSLVNREKFARKLLRPVETVDAVQVEDQLRDIFKVSSRLLYEIVVSGLLYGIPSDSYFLNIKLGEATLHDYMTNERTTFKLIPQFISSWQVASDVAAGLDFMHLNKLHHRDLKPANSRPLVLQSLM